MPDDLVFLSSCVRLSGCYHLPDTAPRHAGQAPCSRRPRRKSGGHGTVAPPVPIPNTEVKRCCADDSWTKGPAKVGRRQIQNPLQTPLQKSGVCLFRGGWLGSMDSMDLMDKMDEVRQVRRVHQVRQVHQVHQVHQVLQFSRGSRLIHFWPDRSGAAQSTYRKPFELIRAWQRAARPSSSAGASFFSGGPATCSSLAGWAR